MSVGHRLAIGLVPATWILLIAGGLVTSTDSGLAVPDWPLSYGTFFPPMVGGILYEHSHRLIAGTVALWTAVLAVWLIAKESRASLKWLGASALAMILLQALLGGLTVIYLLPTVISVAHASLGQVFFGLVVSIAILTSGAWQAVTPSVHPAVRRLRIMSLGFTALVFFQIVSGAYVRHTGGGGLAWHISGACVAGFAILAALYDVGMRLRPPGGFLKGVMVLAMITLTQIGFGIGAFIYTQMMEAVPEIRWVEVFWATGHQALGAVLLGSSVAWVLFTYRSLRT